jgi:hypothetical protein
VLSSSRPKGSVAYSRRAIVAEVDLQRSHTDPTAAGGLRVDPRGLGLSAVLPSQNAHPRVARWNDPLRCARFLTRPGVGGFYSGA